MPHRFVWILALILIPAAHAAAQERPVWKGFDEINKPFWLEIKTGTNQSLNVQGVSVANKQTQTFLVKLTPRQKNDKGWEVDYEIVGIKMELLIGDNTISYDSQSDDLGRQDPLFDFCRGMLNSKLALKLVVNPYDGLKAESVAGLEAMLDKAAANNAQLKKQLEYFMGKEFFEATIAWPVGALLASAEECQKGTWKRTSVMNLGPIGRYDSTYTYSPDKKDKNKVAVAVDVQYRAPRRSDPAMAFVIKKSNLASDFAGGTVTIDPKTGRFSGAELRILLKGTLTIDNTGMDTEVEVAQVQVYTIRTLDADPISRRK